MMKPLLRMILCGLSSVMLVLPAHAQTSNAGKAADKKSTMKIPAPALPNGNAVVGKLKSDDERCQECHGHDGNANDIQDGVGNIGKFPKLAGQHQAYIVKQLREFSTVKRNHEIMNLMAKSLSDVDRADIAAYFSSQKRMQGEGKRDNLVGKNLFFNGDLSRGVLPCVSCHSEKENDALSAVPENPVITGQHRRYLEKQLFDWKAGARQNSPGGIMNNIASALTDAEIEALSDHISGM